MSKLTEYINLIGKGLSNPSEVIEGWINVAREELGTLPEDQLEEVVRRRLICSECPFMSVNASKLTDYKSQREDAHCTLCSCPIKSKTASMSSFCGAKHWNETHTKHSPLDIKWVAYESDKN